MALLADEGRQVGRKVGRGAVVQANGGVGGRRGGRAAFGHFGGGELGDRQALGRLPLRVGCALFGLSQAPLRYDERRCRRGLALVMGAAGEGQEEGANATDAAEAGVSRPWQREAGQRDGARVHRRRCIRSAPAHQTNCLAVRSGGKDPGKMHADPYRRPFWGSIAPFWRRAAKSGQALIDGRPHERR
jgi:hypothetical protein